MRISVVTVGRPKQAGLVEAIREYETRAARYWSLDVTEVKEASARGRTSEQVREREGERLLERIASDMRIVACDPGGEAMGSDVFAAWLIGMRDGAQNVSFVIGGAYGLSERVRKAAQRRLSLAPWILPHELARLVLAEQLYRAGTISRGEPYHK